MHELTGNEFYIILLMQPEYPYNYVQIPEWLRLICIATCTRAKAKNLNKQEPQK